MVFMCFNCTVLLLASYGSAQTILFDDSHDGNGDELSGNLSSFASLLSNNGINIVEFDGSPGDLTSTVLASADALFIHDVELAYTSAEISAINDFVLDGGGLFISGNAPANFNQATNSVLMANFGITFNEANSRESRQVVCRPLAFLRRTNDATTSLRRTCNARFISHQSGCGSPYFLPPSEPCGRCDCLESISSWKRTRWTSYRRPRE